MKIVQCALAKANQGRRISYLSAISRTFFIGRELANFTFHAPESDVI